MEHEPWLEKWSYEDDKVMLYYIRTKLSYLALLNAYRHV